MLRRILKGKDPRHPSPFGSGSTFYLEVIEFQKRGLPHAHILLRLKRPINGPARSPGGAVGDVAAHLGEAVTESGLSFAEIDSMIKAEKSSQTDTHVQRLIRKYMTHGHTKMCIPHHGMQCTKKFPMPMADKTTIDLTNGHIIHKRSTKDDVYIVEHN